LQIVGCKDILLAACFTLHSINATLAIVPQRGAGLWDRSSVNELEGFIFASHGLALCLRYSLWVKYLLFILKCKSEERRAKQNTKLIAFPNDELSFKE
jgi:hypothetical protein